MKHAYVVGIILASISLTVVGMDSGKKESTATPPFDPTKITHILVRFSTIIMPPSFDGLSTVEKLAINAMSLLETTPQIFQQKLFDVLQNATVKGFGKKHPKLPPVVHYWVTTPGSSGKAKKVALEHIKARCRMGWGSFSCLSPIGKLLYKIAESTFTPEEGVKTFNALGPAAKIIMALSDRYQIYMCDNFNDEFLEELKEKHPDLFEQFTETHISGIVGSHMTETEFYTSFIKTIGVPAASCLLIDSEQNHLTAAIQAGMQTLKYTAGEASLQSIFDISVSDDGGSKSEK